MHLHAVSVVVDDYDLAIRHYVDDLGFTLMEDSQLGGGKRWVRVAPDPVAGSCLLLARAVGPEQTVAIGRQAGGRVAFFLRTNEFDADQHHMCGVPPRHAGSKVQQR